MDPSTSVLNMMKNPPTEYNKDSEGRDPGQVLMECQQVLTSTDFPKEMQEGVEEILEILDKIIGSHEAPVGEENDEDEEEENE